jgi:hypothetical protein
MDVVAIALTQLTSSGRAIRSEMLRLDVLTRSERAIRSDVL